MNKERSTPRVFVIGLDGATFERIEPMVREGKLPTFARLMKEVSYGPLKSTMPPITPCAWPSLATGKDPSKHGLFDFQHYEGDPQSAKRVNSSFLKAKSLWKILTEAGKRSIVIDVPITYPPYEINGIMVSRVMAPLDKNPTYPKSFFYTLRRKGFITKPERRIEDMHLMGKADRKDKERWKLEL